jgi:hypothetical protein
MGALFNRALGLAALMVGTGCMDKFDLSGRTFEVPYSKKPGELEELCPQWSSSKDRTSVAFAEPLRFTQLNEAIDAQVYETYLMRDLHQICAGTYKLKATLRRGATGGPAGTATELFVEVSDKRLIEQNSRPQPPPGFRPLLPGEIVVRQVAPGELTKIDDRYVIALPAGKKVRLEFVPARNEYEFKTTLKKAGAELAMTNDRESANRFFDTKDAGLYELTVTHGGPAAKEPDRYSFFMTWGDPLSVTGYLSIVKWRPAADAAAQ